MKFRIVQVTTNLVNEGREPLTNKNNGLIFYKESEKILQNSQHIKNLQIYKYLYYNICYTVIEESSPNIKE